MVGFILTDVGLTLKLSRQLVLYVTISIMPEFNTVKLTNLTREKRKTSEDRLLAWKILIDGN